MAKEPDGGPNNEFRDLLGSLTAFEREEVARYMASGQYELDARERLASEKINPLERIQRLQEAMKRFRGKAP